MVARKKNLVGHGLLTQMNQETETLMTESISAIEVTQEQLVVIESGINSEDPDDLFASVNSHEFLEADSSEIEMNIDADLPEANSSDELVIEDVVEPVITLDATLSIQNVVKLYEKIKKSYSTYSAIEINGSRVSSIDTATLQLLVSLKKDAVKQQKEVVFVSLSPRLIESAGLLGLLEILEINA